MLQNWFRNAGFLDHPETLFAKLIAWAIDPSVLPWLAISSAILIAVPSVVGVWQFAVKWIGARKSQLLSIGRDFTRRAHDVRIRQVGFRNPWPENSEAIKGKIEATFASANALWIKTPSNEVYASEEGLRALLEYLDVVGAHLEQENFSVARQRAKDLVI